MLWNLSTHLADLGQYFSLSLSLLLKHNKEGDCPYLALDWLIQKQEQKLSTERGKALFHPQPKHTFLTETDSLAPPPAPLIFETVSPTIPRLGYPGPVLLPHTSRGKENKLYDSPSRYDSNRPIVPNFPHWHAQERDLRTITARLSALV